MTATQFPCPFCWHPNIPLALVHAFVQRHHLDYARARIRPLHVWPPCLGTRKLAGFEFVAVAHHV